MNDARPADYPMPADNLDIDLSKVVYISGPHHILHNLQDGLHVVLVFWTSFIDSLKHVCRLLSRKWSKQRFMRSCCHTPAGAVFIAEFGSFNSLVYDKRWGTAAAAAHNLVGIMFPLRQCWSRAEYLAGGQVAQGNDHDEGGANLNTADEAINSNKFWGYCLMVDLVAFLILTLSSWFDSCPCHDELPGLADWGCHGRRAYFKRLTRKMRCPLRGRRAP